MVEDPERQIRIDQQVRDVDDDVVGAVEAVVLTPTLARITHVSVSPGGGFTESRLVPVEDLVSDGTRLRLRHRHVWPNGYERTYEMDYLPLESSGDYHLPYPYDTEDLLVWDRLQTPLGTGSVIRSHLPKGEHQLHSGTPVRTTEGRRIGHVAGFFLDEDTDDVTHVVLRHGHLWGRKTMLLPLSLVDHLEDGELVVRGTVADLGRYALA